MATPQIYYKDGGSWKSALLNSYPVGAIYMSSSSTSPANLFGGTWSALTDQKMWLPSNSYNSTGGEWNHTLTINEMPEHTHPQKVTTSAGGNGNTGVRSDYNSDSWGLAYDQGVSTYPMGRSYAHNNMPPYRTCFCWRRTS